MVLQIFIRPYSALLILLPHHGSLLQETAVMKRVLATSNSLGYARAETWSPGLDSSESQISMVSVGLGLASKIEDSSTTTSLETSLSERISVGKDGTVAIPRAFQRSGQFLSEFILRSLKTDSL